ncbi:hypothetical protein P9G84_30915 [Brevibacillus centrosporus]|uniref:hypothetical protein n=1 Tax=Brevibacillus centrosporus TaxID=54910 RepID=UPI001141B286|nr:hypothetical protein [Brevibacillus centrosporus]MEC2133268.1 hypothetical protein [Brevibacillus centrosporus]GED34778.1 hypothetical protein BCE02nite_59190 [Brevibacillus centrosporus]
MFKIRYKPNIGDEALKSVTLDDFIDEMGGEITGHILLEFNGSTVGFYDEDLDLDMFEEMLVCWFDLLNETAKLLLEHDQVALKLIENPSEWILFEKNGVNLSVSFVERSELSRIENYTSTEKFNNVDKYIWRGEKISLEQFRREVVQVTDDFIEYVRDCNASLLSSPTFHSLLELFYINKTALK